MLTMYEPLNILCRVQQSKMQQIKETTISQVRVFTILTIWQQFFFLLLLTSHRISLPKEKEEKRKCLSIFCETLPRNEIIIEARFQFRYSYVT